VTRKEIRGETAGKRPLAAESLRQRRRFVGVARMLFARTAGVSAALTVGTLPIGVATAAFNRSNPSRIENQSIVLLRARSSCNDYPGASNATVFFELTLSNKTGRSLKTTVTAIADLAARGEVTSRSASRRVRLASHGHARISIAVPYDGRHYGVYKCRVGVAHGLGGRVAKSVVPDDSHLMPAP
jgi:hypothetical protein